jgi:hypothetical protein
MRAHLSVRIDGFSDGATIPDRFGFCEPVDPGHATFGANLNPHIRWSGAPEGTAAFAIIMHDPDVPSVGDAVNQEGREVPADFARVDFFHWVLLNVPASVTAIAEGAVSDGVVTQGKPTGPTPVGVCGYNDYTGWFAGNADMAGDYGGYDGPCPPWNDTRLHHYVFTVYALDAALTLPERFDGHQARALIEGHVLAEGSYTGTFTLNPALR